MATVHRVGPDNDIALKLDRVSFDPRSHRLVIEAGGRAYRLAVTGMGEGGWIRLDDSSFAVERVLVAHRDSSLVLAVTDPAHVERLAAEPLLFHQSFFAPLVDFNALALPGFSVAPYAPPALLAVCTHVYDDHTMLRLWERHYARFVPNEHLYVIDHGSTTPAREVLQPATQLVRLPRGAADQANIAQFCNGFQRFLLTQYRWVIHVDVDELLVPQDGFDAFLARLAADPGPPRIVEPAHAADLVQHPDLEAPVDLARPLTSQRRFLVPNAEYLKPALVSRPATWGPGFHYAVESFAVAADPLLWMVHLAKADVGLCLERNRKWLGTPRSATDKVRVDHTHRQGDEGQTREAFLKLLAGPTVEQVPEWMRGMF